MINIPNILQRGEGISVEFKRAKNKIPKNLFETVCAFLNRNGGVILLGVEDNGVVEGVEPTAVEQMKKDIVSENIKFVEEDIFVTEIPLDGDSQIILPDDFEGVIVDKNGSVIERKSKTDLKTDLKTDRIDAFIVDEIIKNDKITIPQIAEKIGRGITVTKDRIAKLKELKIIDRVGSLKGGYWRIIENK